MKFPSSHAGRIRIPVRNGNTRTATEKKSTTTRMTDRDRVSKKPKRNGR